MAYESTHRLSGWRLFWLVVGLVTTLGVAGTACSGSSSGKSGSGHPPTTLPGGSGPTGTTPRTTPRTTPVTTPTTRPTGTVVVPASIDATGKTDVTAALQKFIDKVQDGRTILFRPNGRYRIDETLFVIRRNNLDFEGRGALFATTRGGRDRSQWWIKDGSNIAFHHLIVRGANPKGGTSEGAYVREALRAARVPVRRRERRRDRPRPRHRRVRRLRVHRPRQAPRCLEQRVDPRLRLSS